MWNYQGIGDEKFSPSFPDVKRLFVKCAEVFGGSYKYGHETPDASSWRWTVNGSKLYWKSAQKDMPKYLISLLHIMKKPVINHVDFEAGTRFLNTIKRATLIHWNNLFFVMPGELCSIGSQLLRVQWSQKEHFEKSGIRSENRPY